MMNLFSSLSEIPIRYPAILLDAYGVFWGGNGVGPLPGAKEEMQRLVQEGRVVGILSNSSQLAQKEIDKLKTWGFEQGVHYHFYLTSGQSAKRVFTNQALPFATPQKKYWAFGENHPRFTSFRALFDESVYTETDDLSAADFIYVAIPHVDGEDQTDPRVFRDKLFALKQKTDLPMVCVNADHFAHEGNPPRMVVRQGSIAALYEEFGGHVIYIGKPSKIAFEEAMHCFRERGIEWPEEVLMVGDTPEIDIRGANLSGMASALIMGAGMMEERIKMLGSQKVLDALPQSDIPTYYIDSLGKHELSPSPKS